MMVEDLADFPAVQQLANALWRKGTARGAAVLVGAGFSKYADLPAPDTPKPPLWADLAAAMKQQLYPRSTENAPTDPLRLAEEYRTNFGQAALDEFIRTRIADRSWQPGLLHRQLLNLPWSDVLTTNWDTLLERASDDATQGYEIVLQTGDLPHVRAPRIIKLHGTVGTSSRFIVAEEDYRTYPTHYAPFVNLARQIFIENELCLIGFSGDDPNFLQWSGWVRDHLGDGSRRIYLVGALQLEATKRKFLQARNVAPIDLYPLVQDREMADQRGAATKMFFDFLLSMKPAPAPHWTPASVYDFMPTTAADLRRLHTDHAYAASLLDQAASVWKADRLSYPGWFVCPTSPRQQLRYGTQVMALRQASLDALSPERRAQVLYELAWRHATGHWPVNTYLAGFLTSLLDAPPPTFQRNAQLEIALLLLRTTRQAGDETAFARWANFLEADAAAKPELAAELAYQRCLLACSRLDPEGVARELPKVAGTDPIWRVRRASLHAEVGEFATASKLIAEAHEELGRLQRRDRRSLWIRSRRAWTAWLLPATQTDRFVTRAPVEDAWEYREVACDPLQELDAIEADAAADLRKRREENVPIKVLFEPGHYREPRATRFTTGAAGSPLGALDQLIEAVGMPIHLNHYSMVGASGREALELAFEPSLPWYCWFLRWLSSHIDNLFERYFSRLALAQLSPETAAQLIRRVTGSLAFWRRRLDAAASGPDYGCALDRLRLFIAALSRLTIRQDSADAAGTFALACDLAKDRKMRHDWLAEILGDLLKFSAQAVPPSDRAALLLPALEFPLAAEKNAEPHFWPDSVLVFWGTRFDRPAGDARWTARIQQLIQASGAGQPSREEAARRLTFLDTHGFLTPAESQSFGQTLWSEIAPGDNAVPERTGLLITMFAKLPAPATIDAPARVRVRLFDEPIATWLLPSEPYHSQIDADKLNHIQSFILAAKENLLPTPEQAAPLFDGMMAWRPSSLDDNDPFEASAIRSFEDGVRRIIGDAVSFAIVPAMSASDLTDERANAVLRSIGKAGIGRARGCLPYFLNTSSKAPDKIVRSLRRGVIGSTFDDVAGATVAIEKWIELLPKGTAPPFPEQLVEQVVSAVETRREPGLNALLQCVRRLTEENLLGTPHIARLGEALDDLLVETAYANIDPDSREAVSISLVRAECVKLARALERIGAESAVTVAWIAAAEADPLPEVRFALTA
jgi:SIR2-like domain